MILLDTSILIEFFRKKDKTKTTFFKLASQESDFCISVITYYEILIGSNEDDFWVAFFQRLHILNIDTQTMNIAVEWYKKLKKRNKLLELADSLIASTALAHQLPLATLNQKHFARIDTLTLIDV
jgi:tRNA(fMet)-specific endonuclease VapC